MSKIWLYIALVAAVAGLLALVDNRGYNRGHLVATNTCTTDTVPKARVAEQKACKINTDITKESNDELQAAKDAVDAELAAAKRRLREQGGDARCTPVARKADVEQSAGGQPKANGVSAEWLLEQAARCDKVSTTLNSCIDFVDKVWASQ